MIEQLLKTIFHAKAEAPIVDGIYSKYD
jgi:hypothetical protein